MATEKQNKGEAEAPSSAIEEARIWAEAIVNTVRQPLMVLDAEELRVQSANRSFYQTFQVSAEGTVKRLVYELGNGQWNIPRLRNLLEEILPRNRVVTDFEVEHTFERLGRRTMLLNADILSRGGGRPDLILLVIEDVSERKKAEQALRDAKYFADMIADTILEPLVVLHPNLRVKSANNSFYETFQVTPAETEGCLLYDLGNGQWEIPRLRELLETILPQNTSFKNFEVEHHFARLGQRTMLLNAQRLDDLHLILLAIEDITERKRSEEVTQRLTAIVNTAADAVLTIDERGIIQSVNPATERMFGYSAAEMLGRNVNVLMLSPEREEHDAYVARYLKTGEKKIIGTRREVQARRKDGSTFPVELGVSEFRLDGKRFFAGVHSDITTRKFLQKEVLEVAAREQRRIGQELHDSTGQELTALGLMAEGLAEGLAGHASPDAELAAKIARGVGSVLDQVRDLAKWLVPVEVDSQGLMTALAELAARIGRQPGVACTFQCDEPVSVEDNLTATHLYYIVQEAVTNALKHAKAQHIQIDLAADERRITLRIRDDGVGITDPHAEARGVGLRIMRYRAGLINATLTIELAEEGGTLVTCTLPKEDTHDGPEEQHGQAGRQDFDCR